MQEHGAVLHEQGAVLQEQGAVSHVQGLVLQEHGAVSQSQLSQSQRHGKLLQEQGMTPSIPSQEHGAVLHVQSSGHPVIIISLVQSSLTQTLSDVPQLVGHKSPKVQPVAAPNAISDSLLDNVLTLSFKILLLILGLLF